MRGEIRDNINTTYEERDKTEDGMNKIDARREKREERREKREDTESHKKDKVFFDRHVS